MPTGTRPLIYSHNRKTNNFALARWTLALPNLLKKYHIVKQSKHQLSWNPKPQSSSSFHSRRSVIHWSWERENKKSIWAIELSVQGHDRLAAQHVESCPRSNTHTATAEARTPTTASRDFTDTLCFVPQPPADNELILLARPNLTLSWRCCNFDPSWLRLHQV